MKELLEALRALERLGAEWKARRVTKKFVYDTIESTAVVKTSEGVVRGLIEVQRRNIYSRAKIEVTCFLDGRLEEDGTFKHTKHVKSKQVKLFEHDNEVTYHCLRVFGIKLGYRPDNGVSVEHQFLVDFAERLIAEIDRQDQTTKAVKAAEDGVRKSANETRARKALFG